MNQETQVGSLKWDIFCFGAPHCANSRKQMENKWNVETLMDTDLRNAS